MDSVIGAGVGAIIALIVREGVAAIVALRKNSSEARRDTLTEAYEIIDRLTGELNELRLQMADALRREFDLERRYTRAEMWIEACQQVLVGNGLKFPLWTPYRKDTEPGDPPHATFKQPDTEDKDTDTDDGE